MKLNTYLIILPNKEKVNIEATGYVEDEERFLFYEGDELVANIPWNSAIFKGKIC